MGEIIQFSDIAGGGENEPRRGKKRKKEDQGKASIENKALLGTKILAIRLFLRAATIRERLVGGRYQAIRDADDATVRGWVFGATGDAMRRDPEFYAALVQLVKERGMITPSQEE